MKELSIEEKAKRYDKAIERANELNYVSDRGSLQRKTVEHIFPELKESEDERIRKELLVHCQKRLEMYNTLQTGKEYSQVQSWIAWLEKQGEKDKFIEKELGCIKGYRENAIKRLEELEKQGEQKPTKEHDVCDTCDEKASCVNPCPIKLVEQKPTDKVEPKFKIGDTIKKESTGDIVTISEIDLKNREYRLSNTGFIPFKYEHLWELVEQKPAWSEEDKDFMYDALSNLTELKDRYGDGYGNVGKCINWLKSLRHQSQWKPSDEQMDALHDAAVYVDKSMFPYPKGILMKLYKQLKKLREE